jgi:hypothetical protein
MIFVGYCGLIIDIVHTISDLYGNLNQYSNNEISTDVADFGV